MVVRREGGVVGPRAGLWATSAGAVSGRGTAAGVEKPKAYRVRGPNACRAVVRWDGGRMERSISKEEAC